MCQRSSLKTILSEHSKWKLDSLWYTSIVTKVLGRVLDVMRDLVQRYGQEGLE